MRALGLPSGLAPANADLVLPAEVAAARLDAALGDGIDFANAKPFVMPAARALPPSPAAAIAADDPTTSVLPPQPGPDRRGAPRLFDLLRAADRQCVGRHIAGDDAAGRDDRPGPDGDGRDQRSIRADKRALADYRAELVNAVIIAGDRAGADQRPNNTTPPDRYTGGLPAPWPSDKLLCTQGGAAETEAPDAGETSWT